MFSKQNFELPRRSAKNWIEMESLKASNSIKTEK